MDGSIVMDDSRLGPLYILLMILAVRHCHQTFSHLRQSSPAIAPSLKSWTVTDCQQENFKAFKEFVVVPVMWSSAKYCGRIIQRYSLTPQLHPQGIREAFSVRALSVERDLFRKNHWPRQLFRVNKMAQFFLSLGQWSGKQEDCREPHCVTKIDQFRHSQSQKASTPPTQTGGFQKRAITILQPTKTGEKEIDGKREERFPNRRKTTCCLSLFLPNMLQMVFSKVNELRQKHIRPFIRSLIIDREGEKDNH